MGTQTWSLLGQTCHTAEPGDESAESGQAPGSWGRGAREVKRWSPLPQRKQSLGPRVLPLTPTFPSNPLVLQFDLLEMDRLERPLVNLPLLLDPSSYVPDTVDLTDDALARKYWLTCFEEALDGVSTRDAARGPWPQGLCRPGPQPLQP